MFVVFYKDGKVKIVKLWELIDERSLGHCEWEGLWDTFLGNHIP